jgi:hypothetical protein
MSAIRSWSDVVNLKVNDKIKYNDVNYSIQKIIQGPADSRGTYRTFELRNNSNGNFEEIVIDYDGTIDSKNASQSHLKDDKLKKITGGKRKTRRNKRSRKNRRKTNRRR